MKKSLIVITLVAITSIYSTECFAYGAFDQLQQSASDGNSAANSYRNGSYDYEGARRTSGSNFDNSSDSSTVDLRGAGEHPTPQLLRGPND
ncbi:MAG: hypothetical protein PHC34_11905 [Candidatus Gastranaerophilales bacterium]|nr:hypothetical protein [Candidatus Gastranaerophilales bacterium]